MIVVYAKIVIPAGFDYEDFAFVYSYDSGQ